MPETAPTPELRLAIYDQDKAAVANSTFAAMEQYRRLRADGITAMDAADLMHGSLCDILTENFDNPGDALLKCAANYTLLVALIAEGRFAAIDSDYLS